MKVYFKNGEWVQINQEIAQILRQRIQEGCQPFQVFSDAQTKDVELIINLQEVTYIKK